MWLWIYLDLPNDEDEYGTIHSRLTVDSSAVDLYILEREGLFINKECKLHDRFYFIYKGEQRRTIKS